MYENVVGSKRDHGTSEYTEYIRAAEAIFAEYDIPDEFKTFVHSQAWEIGHSSGYGEVLLYVKDFSYDLSKAIKSYRTRIVKELTEKRQ